MGYDREQTRSYFSRFGTTDRKSDFYQKLLTGNVIALAGMGEECLVLDVGCGFGRYTDRYEKVCTARARRRLVSKYVKNNGLAQILMHPRQFMVSEKVRMLYNSLIESVPEQDFVTHTEIIDTLRGARRATVEYTGLKPAQSQLAL